MTKQVGTRELDGQIAAIARGDKSALAALYQDVCSGVYSYALSVLKNRHDAEDILQDTFLEIWRSAKSYKSMGKPMAWVITVARSLCLMKLRERRRYSDASAEDVLVLVPDSGISPEDSVLIRTCIEGLQDDEREIVIMHAVSGLRHREIAEILGLPLSTVLSKYQRTIKKLKILLEGV